MPRPTRVRLALAAIVTSLSLWPLARHVVADAPAPPASQPTSKPASQPTTQPVVQIGHFQLVFKEKNPLSDTPAIVKRMGWRLEQVKSLGAPLDYDIEKESFEAYVPADYTGAEPYGLFVWISPGPRGDMPGQFYDVIDRHKLIVIGANDAGNPREIWNRQALTLDAVYNMKSRFNIDPRRVYVSGLSGGGRTSSQLAVAYADVFRGGVYMIGFNFYRNMEVEPGVNKFYRANYGKPVKEIFVLARDRSRHVLLTGETDPNRPPTKLGYANMQKDGFRHVTYFEKPGMGHQPPDAEWFEKAVVALDEPLATEPEAPEAPEKTAPSKGRPVVKRPAAPTTRPITTAHPVTPATRPVATTQEAEDVKMLRVAKLFVQSRLYDKARTKLKELLAAYPAGASAKEAQALLKEIGKE